MQLTFSFFRTSASVARGLISEPPTSGHSIGARTVCVQKAPCGSDPHRGHDATKQVRRLPGTHSRGSIVMPLNLREDSSRGSVLRLSFPRPSWRGLERPSAVTERIAALTTRVVFLLLWPWWWKNKGEFLFGMWGA